MSPEPHTGFPQITVVIMVRNEAHNIKACLDSLHNFKEIIVVDNGSVDETCNIVRSFSNTQLIVSEWKGYGGTRQVGVDGATHDWILWFDADERMTPELAAEIQHHITNAAPSTVLSIPRNNYFLDQHIRGCGWSPDRVSRVFHRGYCRFNDKTVHEGLDSNGPIQWIKLANPILHFSYISLKQFFEKNTRYAHLAGSERRRTGRRVFAIELFIRPLWEFFRCYVLKFGFTDGLRGLVICFGSAIYVFSRDAYCLLEKE